MSAGGDAFFLEIVFGSSAIPGFPLTADAFNDENSTVSVELVWLKLMSTRSL